jgi:hypothetical protein
MIEPKYPRLDRLRRKLRDQGNRLSPLLLKLALAAVGESENALTHQECIAALPAYVDTEVEGERVAEKFHRVKRHLDTCDSCSAQYVELLEVTLAQQAGQIHVPVTIPVPDLTFLSVVTIRAFVKQEAAEILAAIAPKQVQDLSNIVDVFFERIDAFGGKFVLQPSAVRALGFESGDLGEALVTLAVTYAATQEIIASLAPEEIDTLATQDRLCARIEELAQTAARSIRAQPALARKIAEQFAARACADPAALRALIEHRDR